MTWQTQLSEGFSSLISDHGSGLILLASAYLFATGVLFYVVYRLVMWLRFSPSNSLPLTSPINSPDAIIPSPKRKYEVVRKVATGDVGHVFQAIAGSESYVLKISRTELGNRLLDQERRVLNALLLPGVGDDNYLDYLPTPVENFWHQRKRITSFVWKPGYQTAEELHSSAPHSSAAQGIDGRSLAWMFNRTLEVLGYVHRRGWVHGAVLPPHLLFHPGNHGLQLVGWTHAERIGSPLTYVPQRYKAWYPPECFQKLGATPATDIYLAAKTMIYLAGGDPKAGYIPDEIPAAIAKCWLHCLEADVARRPQDAWELRDEFGLLLEAVYGPPEFVPLKLS